MSVALVTGAARGIGAATARQLAALGWDVVVVDRCADDPAIGYPLATRADLEALQTAAAAGPGSVTPFVADVRDLAALQEAVEVATTSYGGLDVAIAAAGVIGGGHSHWDTGTDAERAVIDVDLGGVLNLARVAVPAMLRRRAPRDGRFLAVASTAATRGLPQLAAYCAAKAGVTGFVRALAAELRGTGITANSVSPGSTRTEILTASAALYGLPDPEAFAGQQPIERLIEPGEIAAVLCFLAGAGGAAITGADVPADGGLAV